MANISASKIDAFADNSILWSW